MQLCLNVELQKAFEVMTLVARYITTLKTQCAVEKARSNREWQHTFNNLRLTILSRQSWAFIVSNMTWYFFRWNSDNENNKNAFKRLFQKCRLKVQFLFTPGDNPIKTIFLQNKWLFCNKLDCLVIVKKIIHTILSG